MARTFKETVVRFKAELMRIETMIVGLVKNQFQQVIKLKEDAFQHFYASVVFSIVYKMIKSNIIIIYNFF